MIDLYYWTTPNGHKITIFLEEAQLAYQIVPINIMKNEQFSPEFLRVSPNNKIPAIVDHQPLNATEPLALFESGAILLYLAERSKKFLSTDVKSRQKTLEWLFWQVSGLGPMAGQNHHFSRYAPEKIPYAIDRYVKETARLYKVLDKQLSENEFIAGEYSIADMACYPWVVPHAMQQQNLLDFPHVNRWFKQMESRPAVQRAYARAEEISSSTTKQAATQTVCSLEDRKKS